MLIVSWIRHHRYSTGFPAQMKCHLEFQIGQSDMQSQAASVAEYLEELPEDRRETVQAVREEILRNLPKGYEEGMQYGMIGYYVPHSLYPAGYHCSPDQPLPFASLASQKQHVSVYLYCVYSDEKEADWFRRSWLKTGKKLNMGKSCVRFRKLDDVPLKVIGQAVKRVPVAKFIATYEAATSEVRNRRSGTAGSKKKAVATKKTTKRKSVKRKSAPGKTAGKKSATKKKAAKTTAKKTAARKKR